MARTSDLSLADRVARLGLTADTIAERTKLYNVMVQLCITESPDAPPGVRSKLLDYLATWEKSGVPALERPRYEILAEQNEQSMTAQIAARQAAQRAYDEAVAKVNLERAAERAAAEQRVRDAAALRGEYAAKLVHLRALTGLTLRQMAAFTGIDNATLSRYESGRPVGADTAWADVLAQYEIVSRMKPSEAREAANQAAK